MNSFDPFDNRLQSIVRLCVPHLVTFLFMLLNLAAAGAPFPKEIRPDFVLVAVFYWAIFRPTLMPPAVTFALGLTMDLLSGTPPGFYALTYVLVHRIITDQRRFLRGQPYITVWLGFVIVCLAVGFLHWLVFALLRGGLPPVIPSAAGVLISVFTFPPLVLVLLLVHRLLPGQDKGSYP